MNTTSPVAVWPIGALDELFRHYGQQSDPQPVYIEFDPATGRLHAAYDGEIGNAVPADVHHGLCRRYSIPILHADGANALLAEIAPLAQRVAEGFSRSWNGHNTVGVLDTDATAAEEQIETLCRAEFDAGEGGPRALVVWDAWETGASEDLDAAEYGITAATTDDELGQIAQRYLADFRQGMDQQNLIIDGLEGWLRCVRDNRPADVLDPEA